MWNGVNINHLAHSFFSWTFWCVPLSVPSLKHQRFRYRRCRSICDPLLTTKPFQTVSGLGDLLVELRKNSPWREFFNQELEADPSRNSSTWTLQNDYPEHIKETFFLLTPFYKRCLGLLQQASWSHCNSF